MEENIKNLTNGNTDEVVIKNVSKVKTKIYESPDNGKTVYWRYFGENKRHLLFHNKDFKYPWEK